MARPRTVDSRSLRHAALGWAIESVIAESAGMTPGTVADDSGLDEKQIGTLMRGQGNPRFTTLQRLCDGLHVTLAELALREEELYKEALWATLAGSRHGIVAEHPSRAEGVRRDGGQRDAGRPYPDFLLALFGRHARERHGGERDFGEQQ
jgi:DNA-binding phage protein